MSVNKKNSDGSYNQYASKPYVTKDNIGLSKVENKSSEDIRGEITSKNVTDALGYTPVNPNPQFIYDTEAKMTKVVPENVDKGIVAMIGGKTQRSNNRLLNAPVDKISINSKVIPIPSSILNLPDYGCSAGDVYNYVDFEEMVYHHRVGSIRIKDHLPAWKYISQSKRYVSTYDWMSAINMKKTLNNDTVLNAVCNNYDIQPWINVADISQDETIYFSTYGDICVRNLLAESDVQLNELLQNSTITYELDTEELIDISDILPPFMLESGGTIAFENEHNLDVPNVIIYEKEMI